MSDDLISRSALLEQIKNQNIIPILKMNLKPEHKKLLEIEELIINQPTAYDAEKVLEQLKENSFVPGDWVGVSNSKVIMEEKAFRIVKSGGIDK